MVGKVCTRMYEYSYTYREEGGFSTWYFLLAFGCWLLCGGVFAECVICWHS